MSKKWEELKTLMTEYMKNNPYPNMEFRHRGIDNKVYWILVTSKDNKVIFLPSETSEWTRHSDGKITWTRQS